MFLKVVALKKNWTFSQLFVNSIKKAKLIYLYRVELFTFTSILRHIEWKLWTSIKVSHILGKHLSICFLILLFFLQLAEFNLKAPLYSKTLHYLRIYISCALLPFRRFYNQDREDSSCVNVALKKCKISILFFFTIEAAIIKGAI